MKAIGVVRLGGPEVLEVVDLPSPEPKEGEVRITVRAASVNPTDTLIRSGAPLVHARQPATGPWVPGMDVAGHVDVIGGGHDARLSVGQSVVALVIPHGTHGAYARQVVLPTASVVAAPTGLDVAAASTLLMNATTARRALDALALEPGSSIGVTGAAGTLGRYVCQMARHDGLRVVADAAPGDFERVRADGADDVVPRGEDVAVRMLEVVPEGLAGVVDCAVLDDLIVPAVRRGGRLATVREWSGPADVDIEVIPVRARDGSQDTGSLERLVQYANAGVLVPRVAGIYPASRAADAHRRLEEGGVRGRIVLDLDELG